MRTARSLVPAVLASLSMCLSAGAARAELPRVVVVLEETVDGRKATTTSAEVALTASLNKDGYRMVSGEMADKLRRAQAVSLALSGGIPEVLSSLDADVVILGQVEMTKIGTIADAGLVGYRATAVAKLVRVDTAQIVDAFTIEAKGNDFSEAGAAQRAARGAGDELAKQVKAAVASMAKKPRAIDLVVHGVPDRAQIEALRAGISKARGVSSVIVRQSGKGITKLELGCATDAEALATELENGSLPLEVVQTSSSSILARFDLRRGVKLGAVLQAPTVKLPARGAWVKGVLADLVSAELQNVAFLEVVPSGGSGGSGGAAEVTLAVDAAPAGKGLALTITASDAARRQKLFVASGTGSLEDLPALVSAVAKKLDEGFLPALARGGVRPRAETALARAAAAGKRASGVPVTLPVAEVRIDSLKLENLFPAKLGYYQAHPVGALVLQHSDARGAPAVDVKVSVYVPRFMQLKSDVVVGTLEPGERREVPLHVTLDNNTVFAVEENTPTQAEIVVEYGVAGGRMSARRVAPLLVYGRRAIDWTSDPPIAAFVTPQEDAVRAFARSALVSTEMRGAEAPETTPGEEGKLPGLPEGLTQAIAIFQAMSNGELKYVKDPVIPARSGALDTVQFARETLTLRSGDCDDLSVLYASLLESIGVETAFLLVPGHVLVGVGAGVLPDALDRVTLDSSRVLVHEGKTWIPVEATALGKTFREAWAAGASTVKRAAGRKGAEGLTVVETRPAWAQYPPAALPRAAGLHIPNADPRKSGAAREVQNVVVERDVARKAKLDELARAVARDPAVPEASSYAALLARSGDVTRARAVLEAALARKPGSVTLTNNLANVEVLAGDASAAVGRYRAILEQAGPRRGDVLTNIGIAYTRAGDSQKAVEAFDAALAAGSSAAFLAAGFERAVAGEGLVDDLSRTRAAEGASLTVAEQELKSVLQRALEERKKKAAAEKGKKAPVEADRFQNPLPSGARRGDDPRSRLRIAELLRWMS